MSRGRSLMKAGARRGLGHRGPGTAAADTGFHLAIQGLSRKRARLAGFEVPPKECVYPPSLLLDRGGSAWLPIRERGRRTDMWTPGTSGAYPQEKVAAKVATVRPPREKTRHAAWPSSAPRPGESRGFAFGPIRVFVEQARVKQSYA